MLVGHRAGMELVTSVPSQIPVETAVRSRCVFSGYAYVDLAPGEALLVPKGVSHRVLLSEPSRVFYITPGPGGEHRPPAERPGV